MVKRLMIGGRSSEFMLEYEIMNDSQMYSIGFHILTVIFYDPFRVKWCFASYTLGCPVPRVAPLVNEVEALRAYYDHRTFAI